LKANAVKDTSNNGNIVTGPSTGVQVDNAGPATPVIGCPTPNDIMYCIQYGNDGDNCIQYDINED
jgi:hypothetical protein